MIVVDYEDLDNVQEVESAHHVQKIIALKNGDFISSTGGSDNSKEGRISLFDGTTFKCKYNVSVKGHESHCTTTLNNEKWLAIVSNEGNVIVYNIETGERIRSIEAVGIAALLDDGDGRLIIGSKDGRICLWDVNSGECLKEKKVDLSGTYCLKSIFRLDDEYIMLKMYYFGYIEAIIVPF